MKRVLVNSLADCQLKSGERTAAHRIRTNAGSPNSIPACTCQKTAHLNDVHEDSDLTQAGDFIRFRVMELLTYSNPKTIKGERKGYLTFILHLAPHQLSGYNVCASASKGCSAACLNTAGRGRFDTTQAARIRKTKWFFRDRVSFMEALERDIKVAIRRAMKRGLIPVFRLNGTSDIRWENEKLLSTQLTLFDTFPSIQFYDYTKHSNRRNLPPNYHLTFSRSESNGAEVKAAFDAGMNVAVVFDRLPDTYLGKPVINGDESDLRFLDPHNVVVGLKSKGRGKRDSSGFVVYV